MSSARENSVRNLQSLLNVLVGLALTSAVLRLLLNRQYQLDVQVDWQSLPMFLTFLVTLIPFYHGALRHLDRTYVEQGGRKVRRGALLVDFAMLFVEGCLLVALANALPDPRVFAWGLIALLGLDAIWGLLVEYVLVKERTRGPELRWCIINTVAVVVLVGLATQTALLASRGWGNLLLYVALVRTTVDYALCWPCYFPTE